MSAEDGENELQERVRRLESQVASLESRLQRLEGTPAPTAAPLTAAPQVPAAGPAAPADQADLEAHVGTYWLSRVGIVVLITGIAYLITYRFGELGVLARVGLALGRLLIVDLARLPINQRVITFILIGVILIISYTYTRLRDRKG